MNGILIIATSLVLAVNGQESAIPNEAYTETQRFESNERVIGGTVAANHSRPWMVYVSSEETECGGVLIDPRWVLTAAHCAEKQYEPYTVVAGTNQLCVEVGNKTVPYFGEGSEERNVTDIFTESYSNLTFHNDIALLKLDRPFPINKNIKTIALAKKRSTIGSMLEVSGWGATQIGSKDTVCWLRTVEIPVVSKTTCLRVHRPIHDSEICAGYKDGQKGNCDGDSGGPLVDMRVSPPALVGILTVGTKNCDSYSLYSKVQFYSTWIKDTMKK